MGWWSILRPSHGAGASGGIHLHSETKLALRSHRRHGILRKICERKEIPPTSQSLVGRDLQFQQNLKPTGRASRSILKALFTARLDMFISVC